MIFQFMFFISSFPIWIFNCFSIFLLIFLTFYHSNLFLHPIIWKYMRISSTISSHRFVNWIALNWIVCLHSSILFFFFFTRSQIVNREKNSSYMKLMMLSRSFFCLISYHANKDIYTDINFIRVIMSKFHT